MRLEKKEQRAISTVIRKYFPGKGKLYLYGSRVDETKRGGDIDLLLIVENQEEKESIENSKHYLLVDIKEVIGDQKIDFSIATQKALNENSFYQEILPEAIIIEQWN